MLQKMLRVNLILCFSLLLLALNGCGRGGIHFFDSSQVPVIKVSNTNPPVFSWTPPAAYILRVYAGAQDGDGLGELWQMRGGEAYANLLQSPLTYGVTPTRAGRTAPALQAGQTYTVTVQRKDPLGSGSGFTNTHRRYVGTRTFVVYPPTLIEPVAAE